MTITQAIPTSYKQEAFLAIHDFDATTGDTFKLALYNSSATLNASTTAYTTVNEVSGTGYTAGGATVTQVQPTTSGTIAYVDFSDLTFSSVTLTGVRGALIYNSSKANRAVAVLDFGRDIDKTAEDLTITFPAASSSSAILRFD